MTLERRRKRMRLNFKCLISSRSRLSRARSAGLTAGSGRWRATKETCSSNSVISSTWSRSCRQTNTVRNKNWAIQANRAITAPTTIPQALQSRARKLIKQSQSTSTRDKNGYGWSNESNMSSCLTTVKWRLKSFCIIRWSIRSWSMSSGVPVWCRRLLRLKISMSKRIRNCKNNWSKRRRRTIDWPLSWRDWSWLLSNK